MKWYAIKNKRGFIIFSGYYKSFKDCIKFAAKCKKLWGADLQRVNLQGADLRGADLQRVNLRKADLRGADLRGAYLQRVNLRRADLWKANLQRANLRRADLLGANLWRANLWRANLQRVNLRRADLREANLQGANLQGANIDFSCWPLWCGSQDVKLDEKQSKQILAHAFNVGLKFWPGKLTQEQKDWLNDFHKIQSNEFSKFK